jgi:D-serine deaminase-like pyridoxal phosphate-dependent protein
MVDAGLDDVLIPYNLIGEGKLERLAALLGRATVAVSVDDAALLDGLARAAGAAGSELGVLVDCDTGLGRTGVQSPHAAAVLAAEIAGRPALRFDGFMTYPAFPDSRAFLAEAVERASRRGLSAPVVSAGGTPSMWKAEGLRPVVTEYRAGTYAFHDRNTVAAGAATLDDVAMTVAATVVSRPARDRGVLDAGSKSLSSERGPDEGFGRVLEAPGSTVTKLNEEHAYVTIGRGDELELGQQVRVVPNHACVVSNLFDEFVVVRDGEEVDRWPVDARGRSR